MFLECRKGHIPNTWRACSCKEKGFAVKKISCSRNQRPRETVTQSQSLFRFLHGSLFGKYGPAHEPWLEACSSYKSRVGVARSQLQSRLAGPYTSSAGSDLIEIWAPNMGP